MRYSWLPSRCALRHETVRRTILLLGRTRLPRWIWRCCAHSIKMEGSQDLWDAARIPWQIVALISPGQQVSMIAMGEPCGSAWWNASNVVRRRTVVPGRVCEAGQGQKPSRAFASTRT